jgi:hypothetical protein
METSASRSSVSASCSSASRRGGDDADAARTRPARARRPDRRGQHLLHPLGQRHRAVLVQALRHHDELVAAEARHDVALAAGAGQPARDGAQQLVAGAVPSESLTTLKRSRSRNSSATWRPCTSSSLSCLV